jgi:hypothetical protein
LITERPRHILSPLLCAAEIAYGLLFILLLTPLLDLLKLASCCTCCFVNSPELRIFFPATFTAEIAYGLLSILLVTPLLGLLVAQLPLHPRPLALGLGIVCTVPTALACGVAFVQVGKRDLFLAGTVRGTRHLHSAFRAVFGLLGRRHQRKCWKWLDTAT